MRHLVVIFAVICGTMAFDDEVNRVTIRCTESSGVDPGFITRAFQGELIEDPGLRSYLRCFFNEMKFQDDDGNIDFARIRGNINSMMFKSDDRVTAINLCEGRNLIGSSYEDTIFMNFKCFLGLI